MENIERPVKVTRAEQKTLQNKNYQVEANKQFNTVYNYLDGINSEVSSKVGEVGVTQSVSSGTELAKINVDGTETTIYAPTVNLDIVVERRTFSQYVGGAGTSKEVSQNVSKSNYTAIGIVGTENITAGFIFVDYKLFISNNTIYAKIKNDANGAVTTPSINVYVLYVKK